MRSSLIAAVLLLLGAASAQAGVYSTDQKPPPFFTPDGVKPLPMDLLNDLVNNAKGLINVQRSLDTGLRPDQPFPPKLVKEHEEIVGKIKALKAKADTGQATVDDQVNRSAYLIQLGKYQEAIELLEPMARGEQRGHFMVLSNLATAYQRAGQMERVTDYLQQARDSWPKEYPGFTPQQLEWYRSVDAAQFKLARLRRIEAARRPATKAEDVDVDALFGSVDAPVRFVGESGKYEAGKLAAAERAKLPKDALAIVQQLVLWFPEDDRLYWLVAELLNADGRVEEAHAALATYGYARSWGSRHLKEHRQVLSGALEPPPTPSVVPETRKLLLIGGPVVLLFLFFGYLQLREFRRRRADASSAPSGRG